VGGGAQVELLKHEDHKDHKGILPG
jgi:hypothetical protein